MEEHALGIPCQPLHAGGRCVRHTGIRLQERQDSNVAQQAAMVVREMWGMGIGQRRKLRENHGAEQKRKNGGSSVRGTAECHLYSA